MSLSENYYNIQYRALKMNSLFQCVLLLLSVILLSHAWQQGPKNMVVKPRQQVTMQMSSLFENHRRQNLVLNAVSKSKPNYGPAGRVTRVRAYSQSPIEKIAGVCKKTMQFVLQILTAPFRYIAQIFRQFLDSGIDVKPVLIEAKTKVASALVTSTNAAATAASRVGGKVVNKVTMDRDAEARKYVELKLKEIDEKMKATAQKLKDQKEPGRFFRNDVASCITTCHSITQFSPTNSLPYKLRPMAANHC